MLVQNKVPYCYEKYWWTLLITIKTYEFYYGKKEETNVCNESAVLSTLIFYMTEM
jgi:hypothetical protein